MKLDTIQAVRQATVSVLETYGFDSIRVSDVLVCRDTYSRSKAVAVVIPLSGDLCGRLGFVFAKTQLPDIAGRVVRAEIPPEDANDQLDIASEFANIVAGHAMGQLYGLGLGVDISPPETVPGPEVVWTMPENHESVIIPVDTSQGRVEVVLSLESS